jgi:hypothetical protein
MPTQTAIINGCAYGPVTTVSVGASPYNFTNTESTRIMLAVSAGTVTSIQMSIDGGLNFISGGLLGGLYLMNPGHQIQIVYTLAPTVKYWPI